MNFSVTRRKVPSRSSTSVTTEVQSLLEGLNMLGADVILQSSDLIYFRVHKSTLAISSPFFNDLFSLPQPPDGEVVDGLPIIHVSENAETLHSLFTLLYPIPSVMPTSYENNLDLVAASEKYSMDIVLSTVRNEMVLPATEASFRAYTMASSKRLIPEMEAAARVTLDRPMTFELIMDDLLFFEGSALQDLIDFRQRCRDNLLSFFVSFVNSKDSLSKAWRNSCQYYREDIPEWFRNLVSQHIKNLQDPYDCPLPNTSTLRKEINEAARSHLSETRCAPCSKLYYADWDALCDKWLRRVTKARDKVRITSSPSWNCRFHVICRNPSV
jgi:hypothetical protein